MDDEKELQKIAYEITMLRAQADEIQKQLSALQALIEENSAATAALDALKGIEGETLFPIGAGVMVKAKITEKEKVLIQIGARAIAEKSVEEAKKLLAERRTELEKGFNEMQSNLGAAARRIEELSARANELSGGR